MTAAAKANVVGGGGSGGGDGGGGGGSGGGGDEGQEPGAPSPLPRLGAMLRYGADSNRTKRLLATVLNDLFRALASDLAQPADAPVKW